MGGKPSRMRHDSRVRRCCSSSAGYRCCNCPSMPPPRRPPCPRDRLKRSITMDAPPSRRPLPIQELAENLERYGILPPKLILGIDFTKSNEWTGKDSFHGRNLHDIGGSRNPYEEATAAVGRVFSSNGNVNSIKMYGFGDASTKDKAVFGFQAQGLWIQDFDEAIECYRRIASLVNLSGPTSFAPIIEMAISDVVQSGGQYHVLIIIADGQFNRGSNTENYTWSSQEQETLRAIREARNYPLSIFLVGVGDQSSWAHIHKFTNSIPRDGLNNFKFVNLTTIMSKKGSQICKDLEFAQILMGKTFEQYERIVQSAVIGDPSRWRQSIRQPLPTPRKNPYPQIDLSLIPEQTCPICLCNRKDMAFGCGHQTCCSCSKQIDNCPICRCTIVTKIKLYLDS